MCLGVDSEEGWVALGFFTWCHPELVPSKPEVDVAKL
jgi:hypothetical protein